MDAVLHRHRRAWWWPFRCRCGSAHPCGARLTALDGQLRERAWAAVAWYPTYFAAHPDTAARQVGP